MQKEVLSKIAYLFWRIALDSSGSFLRSLDISRGCRVKDYTDYNTESVSEDLLLQILPTWPFELFVDPNLVQSRQ